MSSKEVEIKFRVNDLPALRARLRKLGFHLKTPRTHEMNMLYDLPGQLLRRKGQLLRLRRYGSQWVLTHKGKGDAGRHKTRIETETGVEDGKKMETILQALDFQPTFRYEKFRAEWSDGKGHVVVDETPIGNFGEIEGPARWIDHTAQALGIAPDRYITQTYAGLFCEWKRQTHRPANEMTFAAVRTRKAKRAGH
ncbi:MAG TPA: class IV adenylate cyclase [Terriglobales bacterium]|nr:class IV adenylate cyclase [Terriglobales bacterium]